MEQPPPPSQILLQAEASSAPPFFVPTSAASLLNSMLNAQHSRPHSPLTTRIPTIDAVDGVLGAGIPQGCVMGISSDLSGGAGRVLALRMVVRDLLAWENREGRAMVVDSTGSFPLQTLVEIVKGCVGEVRDPRWLTKMPNGRRMPWRERPVVEGVLERVGITRVFDLEGVWDVVGEVRGGREEEDGHGDWEGTVRERREEVEGGNEGMQMEHEIGGSSSREAPSLENGKDEPSNNEAALRMKTPEVQPTTQHDKADADTRSSQDTQLAQNSPQPPSIPTPVAQAAVPISSPLTPPPPPKDLETSSPLSSPPASPSARLSASSSSLASQLIIEPSPIKERTNTVLSQAYQGQSIPSSLPTTEVSPSQPRIVSPSPLPPSSPLVPATTTPAFAPPTAGFESHMSEAAQRPVDDSDADSSSDTSSYISSPSPPRNRQPPGSQWAAPSAAAPPSILLIDSLPPLLTELFASSDRTATHRQLAQLSRILTQMSRSTIHPLTVILLNSTTIPSAAKSLDEHLTRSIFADVKHIPSFGVVYDGMCDMSLLVSKVPKRLEDAEALYGGHGEECGYVDVVECLRDDGVDGGRWLEEVEGENGDGDARGRRRRRDMPRRKMDREGRWGAFEVVKEGEELSLRDPDLRRKLGEYKDVGFGRRP